MNNSYWDNIFKNWFKLPKQSKLIYYKNPNEFTTFNLERVNPDHIGIIWGLKKKRNPVQIGKVLIPSILYIVGYKFLNIFECFYLGVIEVVNSLTPITLISVCFVALCFMNIPNFEKKVKTWT